MSITRKTDGEFNQEVEKINMSCRDVSNMGSELLDPNDEIEDFLENDYEILEETEIKEADEESFIFGYLEGYRDAKEGNPPMFTEEEE